MCGERAFDAGTGAANRDRERDLGMRFVGIGRKPVHVENLVGTSAGLPRHRPVARRKDERGPSFQAFLATGSSAKLPTEGN